MSKSGQERSPGRPLVLVVDDDPGIVTLMQIGLPRYGFDVLGASTGAAAVELFRREHARVDVALIDLYMPGGHGPKVLGQLRAIDPDMRCCLMSGDCGTLTAEDVQDLRVCGLIQKPFRWSDLIAGLRKCLEVPRPDRRQYPRRAGDPVAVEVAVPNGQDTRQAQGEVVDRSSGGLGLAFAGEPPAADRLRVRPAGQPEYVTAEVKVRHRRRRDGGWLVGCQFSVPVARGQLTTFG
jgi:CheY-like chemotaxis protein